MNHVAIRQIDEKRGSQLHNQVLYLFPIKNQQCGILIFLRVGPIGGEHMCRTSRALFSIGSPMFLVILTCHHVAHITKYVSTLFYITKVQIQLNCQAFGLIVCGNCYAINYLAYRILVLNFTSLWSPSSQEHSNNKVCIFWVVPINSGTYAESKMCNVDTCVRTIN